MTSRYVYVHGLQLKIANSSIEDKLNFSKGGISKTDFGALNVIMTLTFEPPLTSHYENNNIILTQKLCTVTSHVHVANN